MPYHLDLNELNELMGLFGLLFYGNVIVVDKCYNKTCINLLGLSLVLPTWCSVDYELDNENVGEWCYELLWECNGDA